LLDRLTLARMGKRPFTERAISAAVVIPAAVVVIALALLQYNWSNQVSEATSIRLADSLQMSMINWHLDLFRDLTQICVALGVDPDGAGPADVQQFARSFAEWRADAPYPELVSGFYIVPANRSSRAAVLRFDPVSRRFVPDELPAELDDLEEKLGIVGTSSAIPTEGHAGPAPEATADSSHVPLQQFAEGFYPGGMLRGWSFDPDTPALVRPLFTSGSTSQTPGRMPVQWVLLELNGPLIRTRILPDLAQRYFQGTDGLDFQVAVIAGTRRGDLIYSSDSDFGSQPVRDPDGIMDLFGRVQDKASGSPVHVFQKAPISKGPAAAVGVSWFPLLADIPADHDWQLIVRHRRGGPLGAFVDEMRRRDLMISFGVLLLLVISMAILMIASYREQRLAKLQFNFVTTISHELRTPLTVISSAADNIAHGVVESKVQLAQYGAVIGNHARQLSSLVEQVLLFAAARDGRHRYNVRVLNVSEIIEAALADTAGLIRSAQFTVEQTIEPGLPAVMGDLSALSQCLQNLITNALKYGGDLRWMGLRASLEEKGPLGKAVQISVSDRGMGIAPADLPHIFEPFYRSSAVAAAQIRGTGLGLPLAKNIAEALDGDLTVRSVPAEGSTFTLHLPVAEPSGESKGVGATPTVAQL
jgi:signal transduction histidine kinase